MYELIGDWYKAKRLDNGEWVEGYHVFAEKTLCYENVHVIFPGENLHFYYGVDPNTICRSTGKSIFNNINTFQYDPLGEYKDLGGTVYENDLIAIYTVTYDDNDIPIKNKIAVVKVEWDNTYQMLFAKCIEGDMDTIARECDISYLDGNEDYPFTFWMEYMENSHSQWWEWEIIGNVYDKEEEQ